MAPLGPRQGPAPRVRGEPRRQIPSQCSRPEREREGEGRAAAHLALHPDLAPVQLHEPSGQGGAESGALSLLLCTPHLPELLEHRLLVLLVLRGDADPGVGDGHLDRPVQRHRADIDAAALRRELDRVRQQVQ
jgi:hypothetical protein